MVTIGRKTLTAFAMCSLLSLVIAPASWPQNLIMPRTLVDIAHANGCNPIDNFFNEQDPNLINPPYVLGWVREAEYSAVFWCKKQEQSDKPYKLIFAASDPSTREFKVAEPKQLEGCPATIEYWNFPSGLSIETREIELRYFHNVTDTKPQPGGPTNVISNARVIVSNNGDGLTEIFYCHRGQWFISLLH
jgi:hypothetical protein